MNDTHRPIIIGAGLAGLTAALTLAPRPVVLISAGSLGQECSSAWAQGGIAAAMGDDDQPSRHAADTIAAGCGLCDPAAVDLITSAAPAAIEWLQARGVVFDRDVSGQLSLGLEGAHSRRRIVHAHGDATGHTVIEALVEKARMTPSIEIHEQVFVESLASDYRGICGVWIRKKNNTLEYIPSSAVILATGGAAALWRDTTNPSGSWGSGLALAMQAGADLTDLEFMQFHPTAIDIGRDPMPLASEALRGEGAVLVTGDGQRLMQNFARGDLEPRDVVARAIWRSIQAGQKIYLDAREALGERFALRFPTIDALCKQGGIDPSRKPIPIKPAAHYHMGGVVTDLHGRTTVGGIWACGEVASTGFHGANRLASNSLLEATVMGRRVADDVANTDLSVASRSTPSVPPPIMYLDDAHRQTIRDIMTQHVGVLRNADGLSKAIEALQPLAALSPMAKLASLIATSALVRTESRGGHYRNDYPEISAVWQHRQLIRLKIETESMHDNHTAPAAIAI